MVELSIAQLAAGVFAGNVMTLGAFYCLKASNVEDSKVPSWAVGGMLLILGIFILTLLPQYLDMRA